MREDEDMMNTVSTPIGTCCLSSSLHVARERGTSKRCWCPTLLGDADKMPLALAQCRQRTHSALIWQVQQERAEAARALLTEATTDAQRAAVLIQAQLSGALAPHDYMSPAVSRQASKNAPAISRQATPVVTAVSRDRSASGNTRKRGLSGGGIAITRVNPVETQSLTDLLAEELSSMSASLGAEGGAFPKLPPPLQLMTGVEALAGQVQAAQAAQATMSVKKAGSEHVPHDDPEKEEPLAKRIWKLYGPQDTKYIVMGVVGAVVAGGIQGSLGSLIVKTTFSMQVMTTVVVVVMMTRR